MEFIFNSKLRNSYNGIIIKMNKIKVSQLKSMIENMPTRELVNFTREHNLDVVIKNGHIIRLKFKGKRG